MEEMTADKKTITSLRSVATAAAAALSTFLSH